MLLLLLVPACVLGQYNEILEVREGGFLSQEPCGPPCFWNITPGVTNQDQVVEILKSKELFQECDYFDNLKESGSRGFICRPVVIITFQDNSDIVAGVGFKPSQTITVEEVISKYDAPNAVLVTAVGIPENEPHTVMTLYYDDLNVNLSLIEQKAGIYELTPTTRIENIAYSDQPSYESIRRYSQEWNGYSKYNQYNP
jgi:hypothetical protein